VKAGIGFADIRDSFEAGKQAAQHAVMKAGFTDTSLTLAFCTGKHNYQACFEGIRAEVGDAPILGGPAVGIITNDELGYDGYQVGVAVLPGCLSVDVGKALDVNKSEQDAGRRLGADLVPYRNPGEKLILLFYDSIKVSPPPAPLLNVSSYLLDGVLQGIGSGPPPIVGAGLLGTFTFDRGALFCGSRVAEQCASAALLSGDLAVSVTIMHGCKPMSDYHTITKINGPVVYEIDGRPALEVIDDLLGSRDWQSKLPLLLVTLGVNHGEKYAPYDETHYVNRLIVGIVPEDKAIVLFEADFEEGSEFQFMRRNARLMQESARRGTSRAVAEITERRHQPFFALYIDCAGRSAGFSGAEREEAAIVQEILGPEIPLLGFYSGVEIAPLLGRSRGLDWTGVLLILSRTAA